MSGDYTIKKQARVLAKHIAYRHIAIYDAINDIVTIYKYIVSIYI